MQNILDWYNNEEETEKPEQVTNVSIEQEINTSEEPEQEDEVSNVEFENCVKAVGLTEYLRNQLSNYIPMTQVPDLEGFKKDKARADIKLVLNELTNTIAEL
jgi:hypothetical protein